MPTNTIAAILARATAEPEFRNLLLHTPAQALAGYPLTAAELAQLSALSAESFDATLTELDVRESRAVLAPTGTSSPSQTIPDNSTAGIKSNISIADDLSITGVKA